MIDEEEIQEILRNISAEMIKLLSKFYNSDYSFILFIPETGLVVNEMAKILSRKGNKLYKDGDLWTSSAIYNVLNQNGNRYYRSNKGKELFSVIS